MTKKLKAFSHTLHSCEKGGEWFIFSGKARKNKPLSLFASEASKKGSQSLFCHVLSKNHALRPFHTHHRYQNTPFLRL